MMGTSVILGGALGAGVPPHAAHPPSSPPRPFGASLGSTLLCFTQRCHGGAQHPRVLGSSRNERCIPTQRWISHPSAAALQAERRKEILGDASQLLEGGKTLLLNAVLNAALGSFPSWTHGENLLISPREEIRQDPICNPTSATKTSSPWRETIVDLSSNPKIPS